MIAIHLLFSQRLSTIINIKTIINSLLSICQKVTYVGNPEFLSIFINHLHLTDNASSTPASPRQFFTTIMDCGDLDIRQICLIRLRAELAANPANEEFIIWCLPLVVSCIGVCESLSALAGSILQDMVVLSAAADLVVSSLMVNPMALSCLLHTEGCEELIIRLLALDMGFELIEGKYGYLSERFEEYMETGIYDYVTEMDEQVNAGILRNPGTYPVSPFALDGDPELLVNPLRLQPPRYVILRSVSHDVFPFDWLLQIPFWISFVNENRNITNAVSTSVSSANSNRNNNQNNHNEVMIDVIVDSNSSPLHTSGVNDQHNTIRVSGTFVNQQDRSVCGRTLREGGEIQCCLLIGSESITYDLQGCDVRGTEMKEFEEYWKEYSLKRAQIEKLRGRYVGNDDTNNSNKVSCFDEKEEEKRQVRNTMNSLID